MGVVSTPVQPCVEELERRVGVMERLVAVARMERVKQGKWDVFWINQINKLGSSTHTK